MKLRKCGSSAPLVLHHFHSFQSQCVFSAHLYFQPKCSGAPVVLKKGATTAFWSGNAAFSMQCSKLRSYFVHLPGAKTSKMVHPAIFSCVTNYINLSKCLENHAHTGCTGFKSHAPCSQNVHTGCRVHPSF